ncbi:RNA polymerase sigma-70 factor [uncultured Bacteroides sp.]|jgi:RNA polymerase sigma factor, sigma-70 family/RNA polymerase sigma-70 factor, Bacteroides expansion family 1|uniref:RNA polymerase sigma factor n=1 Tax=uncultured Bacteroides sp. TaxID=162156 RepID=UPI002AAA8664|nr:RNA polymerase sigma-70 factor [uncultured Bacteroides sp.]
MENVISLAGRIKKGDRAAFNELYLLYYSSLHNYGRSFLSATEAEDTIQDVFLNVWLHKENIDESLSLKAYLFRSVYNSALNVLKKKQHDQKLSDCEQEIELARYQYYDPDANEVIQSLYNNDIKVRIDAAIESLPPKCKEVFLLSYIEDMPSKDISEKLDISLSTVQNHTYNALKQLREKLRKKKNSFDVIY